VDAAAASLGGASALASAAQECAPHSHPVDAEECPPPGQDAPSAELDGVVLSSIEALLDACRRSVADTVHGRPTAPTSCPCVFFDTCRTSDHLAVERCGVPGIYHFKRVVG